MRKFSWTLLLAAIATLLFVGTASAADHNDSPTAQSDPAADLNDLYVFRSTDGDDTAIERTVFILTVNPGADGMTRFSDAVEYTFMIADLDSTNTFEITCTADAATIQQVTCAVPGGAMDAKNFDDRTDGNRAAGADVIVFAGLADDPFFFDGTDFATVLNSVLAGSPDPSPLLDMTGTDSFAGGNVLAIVVDVRNSVFGGATNLGVWAKTTRMGN